VIELPQGPFDVILADPPWRYAERGPNATKYGGGASGHYCTMETVDIAALPVASIASPRAMLFLWATWPLLPDALRVIEAWGFEYLTI
jgi:N6-adenosine-specific RNA methylase IME4